MKRSAIFTHDLTLASALLTMGCKLITDAVHTRKEDGTDQYIFLFSEKSNCGEYKTRDLISAWYNDNYFKENPECVFAAIKVANANRQTLLDEVKGREVDYLQVVENGRVTLVNANATEEQVTELYRR